MKKVSSFKGKLLFLLGIALFAVACAPPAAELQWYRGSLHAHSYWSDGDDFPEMAVEWYKSHGYHFLALTEHNILAEGEMWVDVDRLKGGMVSLEKYLQRFGANWIEERTVEDKRQIRLKTFAEYHPLFDEEGRFVLLLSEEITDGFEKIPVHINAYNLVELIPRQRGGSVVEVMRNNLRAVRDQRERTGQPMIAHLNHPNWRRSVTAEELLAVPEMNFFEIYNGEDTYGDSLQASQDRLWDIVLTRRLSEQKVGPVYGLGVDDTHSYHEMSIDKSNPGRCWVMVQADRLTSEDIIAAIEAGDFYASTGVYLKDIRVEKDRLSVEIEGEEGVDYTTCFIGTRRGYDPGSEAVVDKDGQPLRLTRRYSPSIGEVLAEVKGTSAAYRFAGDELYVRAKVISDKLMPNPCVEGEVEVAWTQPVVVAPAGR